MEWIAYGTQRIEYKVCYRQRKTLAIHVYPDSKVKVVAPVGATKEAIQRKVQKRARWIVQQQQYFERIRPSTQALTYTSGETHRYLGRSYRLKVQASTLNNVKLKGRYFVINTTQKTPEAVRQLLDDWYRAHALLKFEERLARCYVPMKREGIPYPSLALRRMSKRWGSCTPEGKILLNPALIKAPVYCIDYVLVHELCHLKHHNHSSAFYHLKSKYMPDWEERKRRLEGIQTTGQ